MEFTLRKFRAQPYIYVDRESSYDGPSIAAAMGSAFQEIFAFVGQHGIKPKSAPMSVYTGMDPAVLRFRGGVIVTANDAKKAAGAVKADRLPAGEAICATHVGPYASLNQSHRAMWAWMEAQGIPGAMPVWEIYIDDPGEVEEAKLRTLIHRAVAG